MDTVWLLVAVMAGYVLMYRVYGRFLSRKIFRINAKNVVPSHEFEDGIDYVPTKKEVIFGHHFTSIAGTGPIVGPAVAIIWGWVPAVLWVFIGSIFMGAVHDFGSLVISLRNQGKSISEYTSKYISKLTRLMFFLVVFLELWIVIAVFGLVIALIFNLYPQSVYPVWLQVVIAVALGIVVKRGSTKLTLWTIFAVVLMYFTVGIGVSNPVVMPSVAGIPATGVWTIFLLIYAFIASVLPVTTLLQPRDYINAYQLIVAMALLIVGIFAASFSGGMEIVAPAVNTHPQEAPSMFPVLFITIACGAISGFHSLVSSGTSAKQVGSESDSLFVGYGSMLTEGALAVLVIIAVSAGIGLGYEHNGTTLTGFDAWSTHYKSWTAAQGLGSKLHAFVAGAGNMISSSGIPHEWALAIMGVFVASFAGTTLDTATRIQRYIVTELFTTPRFGWFKNIYFATFFVVATAALLAFASGANGDGALALWPLFGAVNQTLAALALIVITVYLRQKGGLKWLVSGIPAVFMIIVTLWATVLNEIEFIRNSQWLLTAVNSIVMIAVLVIVYEGSVKMVKINVSSKKTVT